MEENYPKMEGSSDMSERIARDSYFLDLVFKWSVKDIFSEHLYKEKVKTIPDTFQSITEYFEAFVFPLLEETRAVLHSSLEEIHRAPYAILDSCHLSSDSMSNLFDIKIDYWRRSLRNETESCELTRILPGDIFIVVESMPQTVDDLRLVGQKCILAYAVDTSEDGTGCGSSLSCIRVKASSDCEKGLGTNPYVFFLTNARKYERMWNALHTHRDLKLIKEVLQSYPVDKSDDCQCVKTDDNGWDAKLDVCLSSRLNPLQKEMIVAFLYKMKCDHNPSIGLVCGPPGTGKTKTISTLLYVLGERNFRALMCATSNVAIAEVANHVLLLFKELYREDSDKRSFSVANILLLDNNVRLKASSDIENISLQYRVERLTECFDPFTGWSNCFHSLLNFLEGGHSLHNDFVKNEWQEKEFTPNDTVYCTEQHESFLHFVRSKFKDIVQPVRRCVSVLCGDLPGHFLSNHNIHHLQSLASELDSFETLLFQNDLDTIPLLELFSHTSDQGSLPHLPALINGRAKCISALRVLIPSLSHLNLPDVKEKYSVLKFCLQIATLILCDAHTSFELYGVKMEPMDVLIVDEAAQLNECESMIPLQLPGLNHAILFGDEHQLLAKVNSNLSSKVGYGRSLFHRLSLLNWPKHILNIQYRMHPMISSFPNCKFYLNQILDAPIVKDRSYEQRYLPGRLFGPYSFINVIEGREELDDGGHMRNLVEVAVVMKIFQFLYREWHCCGDKLSVGLIATSVSQAMEIERSVRKRYHNLVNFTVKVNTIEKFQGREYDVVIISTVISSSTGCRELIWDCQQINVALTRARHCLWLIGNEKVLAKEDPIWEALICNAKERKCFFNADEDENIAQVITKIKSELDQLEDLLNKESVVFKQARWKVLFSETFVKKFSNLPSTRNKKLVLNFLLQLSNGWRPKKVKSDPVCQNSMKIAKQYKVGSHYIICTKDIVKEIGYATQVLKVWDILHLEDVAELVHKLDKIYGAFSEAFLIHCKQKCLEGSLEVPRCYKSFDVPRYKVPNNAVSTEIFDHGARYAENTEVKESLLLMKFYSLSAGAVSHLLSASDGRALNLPFEVTDEEREVISYQRTTFVLGRSGTGKTTVLAMKMVQNEQIHHMVLEGFCEVKNSASTSSSTSNEECASETSLRQLFVTVNSKLSSAVKQHISSLRRCVCEGTPGEGRIPIDFKYIDETDEYKDIPSSFVDIPTHSYPLVIPFHIFLLMLDGTVGTSFFDRFPEIRKISCVETASSRLFFLHSLMRRKEVGYHKFVTSYWPHLNSNLKRNLDPLRVFTELYSCIKGGVHDEMLDGSRRCLSSYLQLSKSRISIFTEQEREMMYSIFLDYEKMKSVRGEFDLADLVNDLHCRLKHGSYQGDYMDFVYIDEVQDLSMKEIALFKYICKNMEDGFVFAGDTAQTIARGVDFRFQDIRSLFYREFLHGIAIDRKDRNQDKGKISPIFHLTQNFRTHAGVLKLAQSVVELIYHFFPLSIDVLYPETSLLYGEAPILLDCGSDSDAIIKIFQNGGNVSKNVINFGSEQVILVRDDCARDEIYAHVGKHALVLTIFECKGLEFQDVLLYNFFGSSPLKSQWRVIYEYMEKNMVDNSSSEPYPIFNHAKHNVLCSELKQLYVAITRTRQRLWISENVDGISSPIFDYWQRQNIIQVRKFDESFAQTMQVASSQEDWRLRGIKMLQAQNYKVAEICFERARDGYWKSFARAMSLKAEAEVIHGLRLSMSLELLKQAAEIFESINNGKEAAKCYYDAEDYEKAGKIFYRESNLQRAGQCFNLAGCYERAAEVYAQGDFFYECLYACSEGKLFDLGLHYVRRWKHQADLGKTTLKKRLNLNATEQEFLQKCALGSYKKQDKQMMMKYVRDFASLKSKRNFLKKLGCFAELVQLELELGNYLEAAKIARLMRNILLEANILDQAGYCRNAAVLYLTFVLASSLWSNGNKGWPLKGFSSKEELLLKAKTTARKDTPDFYEIVCSNIPILKNESYSFSELKQQLSKSIGCHNLTGEILSARRILDTLLETDVSMFTFGRDIGGRPIRSSNERVSLKMVSIMTLTYHWHIWKRHVPKIFRYLNSLKVKASEYIEYEEFCLGYLGVRKLSDDPDSSYFILYPDAEWVKHVTVKSDKMNCISTHQLVTAAHCHWCTELLHVGKKLLKKLDDILKFATKSSMPISCIRWIYINIFEATQFLMTECKFLNLTRDMSLFVENIELTAETYFYFVFSFEEKTPWSKEITLQTEALRKLLKETLLQRFMVRMVDEKLLRKETDAQLIQVALLLLGSSRETNEQYSITVSKIEVDSPWKALVKGIINGTGTEGFSETDPGECTEGSVDKSVYHLHDALYGVYKSSWRQENYYITPSFYLYLLERLFVLVSCLNGCLLATRSSIIEWLIHLNWKVDANTFSNNGGMPVSSTFASFTYEFLAYSIHQLIMNHQDTQEWNRKAGLNSNKSFPILITRLVVLMCLICVNSGKYLQLLSNVFQSEILEVLPPPFVQVMVKSDGCTLVSMLAQALLKIEDPLVVIRREMVSPNLNLLLENAIFLNVFNRSKGDILGMLFRRM